MKEDTGQILIVDKIVNNNIVIAKDFRGREVVAIGKGVGFRKRKNEAVHRSEIMKTYVLLDKVDSGVLTLFEEIQFEVIETSQKIIDYAQEKLNVKFNVNLLMSLSDHINFALIQYRQGNHVPKLVNEEVKRFYKEEYHIGEIAVQMINERFQILFSKLKESLSYNKSSTFHEMALQQLHINIASNPSSPWNIPDMAKQLHISTRHLQKLYQKKFGTSCMEDVIEHRLLLAKEKLATTTLPIYKIAEQCGYSNVEHFSRQFKEKFTTSPKAYRESVKKN